MRQRERHVVGDAPRDRHVGDPVLIRLERAEDQRADDAAVEPQGEADRGSQPGARTVQIAFDRIGAQIVVHREIPSVGHRVLIGIVDFLRHPPPVRDAQRVQANPRAIVGDDHHERRVVRHHAPHDRRQLIEYVAQVERATEGAQHVGERVDVYEAPFARGGWFALLRSRRDLIRETGQRAGLGVLKRTRVGKRREAHRAPVDGRANQRPDAPRREASIDGAARLEFVGVETIHRRHDRRVEFEAHDIVRGRHHEPDGGKRRRRPDLVFERGERQRERPAGRHQRGISLALQLGFEVLQLLRISDRADRDDRFIRDRADVDAVDESPNTDDDRRLAVHDRDI